MREWKNFVMEIEDVYWQQGAANEQTQGSDEDFVQAVEDRRVTMDTVVWTDGMDKWCKLSECPGLKLAVAWHDTSNE